MEKVYLVDYHRCQLDTCGRPCITQCPVVLSNARKKPNQPKDEVPIRVKKSTHQIIIKGEPCLQCGICANVCPVSAIHVKSILHEPTGERPTHEYPGDSPPSLSDGARDSASSLDAGGPGGSGDGADTKLGRGFRLYGLPTLLPGVVTGLCGPNGIGKSTVLDVLAGRLKPNFGVVTQDPAETPWTAVANGVRENVMRDHFVALGTGTRRVAYKHQVLRVLFERYRDQPVGEILASTGPGPGTGREPGREADPDWTVGGEFLERIHHALDLAPILDRTLHQCSGGELQRFAIARILLQDADVYLIDEPCTFLDVKKRIQLARLLRDRARGLGTAPPCPVLVVDHDLAVLDYVSDNIHLFYGVPHQFGVVSRIQTTKKGINAYLNGFLAAENIQFRESDIQFKRTAGGRTWSTAMVAMEYERLTKTFDGFHLEVNPGLVYRTEVLGIVGENGCGKSTFARILAGDLQPDPGTAFHGTPAVVSYKPQYITRDHRGTVREFIVARARNYDFSPEFVQVLYGPLGVEKLFDVPVRELSGGELQRVYICACLAKRADLYILDEPSAYLDVEERLHIGKVIRTVTKRANATSICIEHDIQIADALVDRVLLFSGTPGVAGRAEGPFPKREGMNRLLEQLDVTFRRDRTTGRARINKAGSRLDQVQRASGNWWGVND